MSKKVAAVLFVTAIAIIACTAEGPTTPPEVETLQRAPEPVAEASPTPTSNPVADPSKPAAGVTVSFGNNASWDVHNNNGQASEFWAYTSDFDNQDLAREVKYGLVRNGDHFADTFGHGCVQLDITQEKTVVGGRGGHPIAAAYYDQNGKKVSRINDDIRKACNARPCVEKWVVDEEPEYGEWGACSSNVSPTAATEQSCSKSRKVTYYEKNTCTQARRVAREATESTPCECACEATWVEQQPSVTTSAWSLCVLGTQSRTVRTLINEINSCTEETRVKSDTTITETQSCQTPGLCFYTVTGQTKKFKCEFKLGGPLLGLVLGQYGKWVDSNQEHCKFPAPGIHTDLFNDFNLVPGQSDPSCNSR